MRKLSNDERGGGNDPPGSKSTRHYLHWVVRMSKATERRELYKVETLADVVVMLFLAAKKQEIT